MRAGPYDLTALGYPPVPVETPQGRARYVSEQAALATRADPTRQALIALCEQLLTHGQHTVESFAEPTVRRPHPVGAEGEPHGDST
jgi:hypothetical protein